jgi:hypothetical protein
MIHYTGRSMFEAIAIPDHLVAKIKKRDVTRDQFMNALLSMEAGTMIEVPDAQYKYNTVRGRVGEANKRLRLTRVGKSLSTTRQNGTAATLVMCHAA